MGGPLKKRLIIREEGTMDNYLTIESLSTIAGMVLVLNLLVQFLKPLIDKIKKVPTQYVVWVLALALSVIYQWIAGEFTVETIFVMIINTIVITLAAMKSYELTTK